MVIEVIQRGIDRAKRVSMEAVRPLAAGAIFLASACNSPSEVPKPPCESPAAISPLYPATPNARPDHSNWEWPPNFDVSKTPVGVSYNIGHGGENTYPDRYTLTRNELPNPNIRPIGPNEGAREGGIRFSIGDKPVWAWITTIDPTGQYCGQPDINFPDVDAPRSTTKPVAGAEGHW